MFKLAQKKEVTYPVMVSVPQDGGSVAKHSFEATFEVLPQSELDRMVGNEDVLVRVLKGFRNVRDENGQEVPFTEETKAQLLEITYVRVALQEAYFALQRGQGARKNA